MDFALALVVLVLALAALAVPLYRARARLPILPAQNPALDDLLAERDGLYATLRDLDTDRQLDKLGQADYEALREKYMTRAAAVLAELDTLRGTGVDTARNAELEREIAALRRTPLASSASIPAGASSTLSAPLSTAAELPCPNCGRPYRPGDRFCARCGQPFDDAGGR